MELAAEVERLTKEISRLRELVKDHGFEEHVTELSKKEDERRTTREEMDRVRAGPPALLDGPPEAQRGCPRNSRG